MNTAIGIRREDKNRWERRVPFTPDQVARLVSEGLDVVVQPSKIRAFPDGEYRRAGARIEEDLAGCGTTFAVKEIPIECLRTERAYVCFAHVIKGQPHNMAMLRHLLEARCTLIDYERITDSNDRRLVTFGRHAGLAGMVDTLWALGRRCLAEGLTTPFSALAPMHTYADLAEAKRAVRAVGERLSRQGVPRQLRPLTIGLAGYGNTSRGAQEILELLPHTALQPEALPDFDSDDGRQIFVTVFREADLVERSDASAPFQLHEYLSQPELYRSQFARHVPKLTVMMNCTYWNARYPRLITKPLLRQMFGQSGRAKLRVIGDISCDVNGAVECNVQSTTPDAPVYVYQPSTDDTIAGVAGDGPVVLAVDNLPCELAREASGAFGDAVLPFVAAIARADYGQPYTRLDVPPPIRRAIILHRGELTPGYRYLAECVRAREVAHA